MDTLLKPVPVHDLPPRPLVAAHVMTRDIRTCSPFSTVTEAVVIFKAEDCGLVPVVDAGKPIGVVTDRDIALGLADHPDLASRPVSEIMTRDLVTVSANTPLAETVDAFATRGVRRLLVTDDEGLLVGVLAWADVAPHLLPRITGQMVKEIVEQP
jgi:CBS domain-containing protein